jgi:hypothetical protein
MTVDKQYPATVTVEIQPDALKHIVEQGRLLEFTETFSALAAQELKAQLLEHLAKAGVGLTQAGEATHLGIHFDINDDFGVVPHHHWPWGQMNLGSLLQQVVRGIVQEEVGRSAAGKM